MDYHSENSENIDIEDNIAENATKQTCNMDHYEGEISPYIIDAVGMTRNNQVKHHHTQGVQNDSLQATEW